MAHYAILDENNIVIDIFVGKDEGENSVDWESEYSLFHQKTVKRYSINTQGNVHTGGKEPFRKNAAMIGGVYDPQRDAFIPKKQLNSWILNELTCLWEPPVTKPDDGKNYYWDESLVAWVER